MSQHTFGRSHLNVTLDFGGSVCTSTSNLQSPNPSPIPILIRIRISHINTFSCGAASCLPGPHKTHSLKLFWQGVSNSKFSDSYPHLPFEQPRNSPKPCFQIVKNGGKSAFETFICVRREIARIYIESGYGKRKEFAEALNFCCYSHAFRPGPYVNKLVECGRKTAQKTDRQFNFAHAIVATAAVLLFLLLLELSWFLYTFSLVFN